MAASEIDLATDALPSEVQHLVVGYRDSTNSLMALRWAIDVAERTGAALTVVHASSFPIRVCNGPSAAVAHSMGNPTWATVHSVVQGLGAAESTTTIVEPGAASTVLAKHSRHADAIILGRRRKRFAMTDLQRVLERRTGLPVLRIDDVLEEVHTPAIDTMADDLLSMP